MPGPLVWNECTAVHVRFGLATEVGVSRAMRAQQVAAGDVRDTVFASDAPRLCALPGPDRTQQDEIKGTRSPIDTVSVQ